MLRLIGTEEVDKGRIRGVSKGEERIRRVGGESEKGVKKQGQTNPPFSFSSSTARHVPSLDPSPVSSFIIVLIASLRAI